jgi:polysaccharide export outer membrane protein
VIDSPEKIDKHAGIVIQPKDMLSIVVSSRNPELVAMFNLPVVSYQAGSEVVNGSYNQRLMGYVVDNEGCIDFPVLGVLEVAGLTRWELSDKIKNALLSQKLLADAVVTVEFMNFKVSVIGEVTSPGTYTVEGDKVTILQAISLARDLTIFGERENVSVIRERNGERTIYEVNLCDVNLFKSPAYYLQQNGFNVIPVASWCLEEDIEWCFDGLPTNSSIAITTNGCKSSTYAKKIFFKGVEELIAQKNPSTLVVCGREVSELNEIANVMYYPNFSQRWKERVKNG